MSKLYDEVKALVDNFDQHETSDELHHALLDILLFCDAADSYGDDVETEDIRTLVTDRLGDAGNE